MEFTIPQFIEREPKIVGPFTFKQFVFVGIAGGISLLLYFTVPFWLFIIALIILVGGSLALAFVKVQRTSMPILIKNFFLFLFKSKVYLWKKKVVSPAFSRKEEEQEPQKKEGLGGESRIGVVKRSALQDLSTRMGIRAK